jgi:hypothetical protein
MSKEQIITGREEVIVTKEAIAALNAYLSYITHLEKQRKKSLLRDFLRRHVQDVCFAPFISEQALDLAKKNGITAETLKSLKFPYVKPGFGIPKNIRPLFTNGDRGKKASLKIFHFEHNIPAGQGAEMLLNIKEPVSDEEIEKVLKLCTLCLITVEEDDKLNGKGWKNTRPLNAYEELDIKLLPLSRA